ncbi:prephenate dehydrogenase [Tepidibacter aestuarii]|uniref:prephenate dehydrogenase n=1 Tax=Tepidibacter aestuarii TaxID=2925782 RepID=UPI0020BEDC9F|nr:prephenate dehydrogenase [Tepidibacter aestuarii]
MDELDFNITIVGLGLIGGSFAMALNKLKPKNLWAVDIDEDAIKTAKSLGIIDKGYLQPEIPLKNSDIVIICLYPELTIKFINDNMNNFKSGAIITDTAGIKHKILEKINSFLRKDLDFIGAHPMAGRESKGIGFASKDIFNDANYIITPTNKNKKENIEILENIIKSIGCKNIVKVSPKKHDEIIAFTSQLPHIIASALVNSDIEENTNLFIGGSFKDATRVANMNTQLWLEVFIDNGKNIIEKIDIFEKSLSQIKNLIINKDIDSLESIFEKGKLKRGEIM